MRYLIFYDARNRQRQKRESVTKGIDCLPVISSIPAPYRCRLTISSVTQRLPVYPRHCARGWREGALRRRALRGDLAALYGRPETDTLSLLTDLGFSRRIIERFFKPFFAGVFFEPELDVFSRAFEFVFRAFALGDTALPARGIGTIPAQLAAKLPPESIRLHARVQRLLDGRLKLNTGEHLLARTILIATGGGRGIVNSLVIPSNLSD